jgi:NADPH2:quinone reductase
MKAIVFDRFGAALHESEMATPQPSDHEVQIQIKYSGVNPVDYKIREGLLENRMEHGFPLIPGWDAAGVISAVGNNVSDFKIGDEVFAYVRKAVIQDGTYAEYVTFEANNVAPKPKNISFAQAAAIPLVVLTAWQALFDMAQLKKDETVFIPAGAGGVGSLAIPIAKHAGARVYSSASSKNHDYVYKLGATEVIDYSKEDFVAKMKELVPEGVDVVFDTMGGENLKRSFDILKPGGRIVSIVAKPDADQAAKRQVKAGYVFVRPNGKQLREIAHLIETGVIPPPHIEEMDLSHASEAQDKVKQGHTKGKIVLKVN